MNIFAYTAPGVDYPPFISVNRTDEGVEFIVRSKANDYPGTHENKRIRYAGDTASIVLTVEQVAALSRALENNARS